jgi:hypothetical protein
MSHTAPTQDVVSALANLKLTGEDGAEVSFASLWADKPAVIAWVRHFGCLFCREHVVHLNKEIERIHAAGGELVVVGSGTPNFIGGLRERTGFTGPIYSDIERTSYRAAGLKRGWLRILNPVSGAHAIGALAGGFRQSGTQGDNAQQGGVLVVLPPGRAVYQHVSKIAGDNAPAGEVVEALEAAVKPAAQAAK